MNLTHHLSPNFTSFSLSLTLSILEQENRQKAAPNGRILTKKVAEPQKSSNLYNPQKNPFEIEIIEEEQKGRDESDEETKIPTKQKQVRVKEPHNGRGIRNMHDGNLPDEDEELDIRKVFMQHKQQEIENFASEKILERQGGFLAALNEPFCPPAMQFHNPKGADKNKKKQTEMARQRRKEVFDAFQTKSKQKSKPRNNDNFKLEHLQGGPKYIEKQARPILKVKSTAEQHKEENKSDDVLLSQDAMREILAQLSELQELKRQFGDIKKQSERVASPPKEKSPRKSPERSPKKSPIRSPVRDEKHKSVDLTQKVQKQEKKVENQLESNESLHYNSGKLSFGNDFAEYDQSLEDSKVSRRSSKTRNKLSKMDRQYRGRVKDTKDRLNTEEPEVAESLDQFVSKASKQSKNDKKKGRHSTKSATRLSSVIEQEPAIIQSSTVKKLNAVPVKFKNPQQYFRKFSEFTSKKSESDKKDDEEDIDSIYTSEFES